MNNLQNTELTRKNIEKQDLILITTDHTNVDYDLLAKHAKVIVDTRNRMATVKNPKARVIRA